MAHRLKEKKTTMNLNYNQRKLKGPSCMLISKIVKMSFCQYRAHGRTLYTSVLNAALQEQNDMGGMTTGLTHVSGPGHA